jgi:hypothetical protein
VGASAVLPGCDRLGHGVGEQPPAAFARADAVHGVRDRPRRAPARRRVLAAEWAELRLGLTRSTSSGVQTATKRSSRPRRRRRLAGAELVATASRGPSLRPLPPIEAGTAVDTVEVDGLRGHSPDHRMADRICEHTLWVQPHTLIPRGRAAVGSTDSNPITAPGQAQQAPCFAPSPGGRTERRQRHGKTFCVSVSGVGTSS